MKLVTT
jgi:hypothetical protein